MTLLQWNMGVFEEGASTEADLRRVAILGELVDARQPDVIAVQEAPRDHVARLLRGLGYEIDAPRHRLLTAWRTRRWAATVQQPFAYERVSALVLQRIDDDGAGPLVLVCNVHAPSRLHKSSEQIEEKLGDLVREIQSYRSDPDTGTFAEVIVGDFNLEPHRPLLHSKSGLFGCRSHRHVAEQELARHRNGLLNERTRALYNPSWQLSGGVEEPLGTYYYTGEVGSPWFVFDQALFSTDLVAGPVVAEVVAKVGGRDLLTSRVRKPNPEVGSDHLPVVWRLRTAV